MRRVSVPCLLVVMLFLPLLTGEWLRFTLALERKTGRILRTREAPGHRDEKRHQMNDPAAPAPVSDRR